jgi:hypothetical protein
MLYVVVAYITIGFIALVFLPEHAPAKKKYSRTIFDRDEKPKIHQKEDEDIEKIVDELLKDV